MRMSGQDHDQLEPSWSKICHSTGSLSPSMDLSNKEDAKYIKDYQSIISYNIRRMTHFQQHSASIRFVIAGLEALTAMALMGITRLKPAPITELSNACRSWRLINHEGSGKSDSTWPRINPRNATKTSLIFISRFGLLFVLHFHWKIQVEIAF